MPPLLLTTRSRESGMSVGPDDPKPESPEFVNWKTVPEYPAAVYARVSEYTRASPYAETPPNADVIGVDAGGALRRSVPPYASGRRTMLSSASVGDEGKPEGACVLQPRMSLAVTK